MKRLPLWIQLVAGLLLGAAVGSVVGSRAAVLGELALLYVKILKVLATPLVFLAIVETLSAMKVRAQSAGRLLLLSSANAAVAVVIALSLSHALPIGRWVDLGRMRRLIDRPLVKPWPIAETLSHVLDHLMVGNILWVIGAAILVGVAWRMAGREPKLPRQGLVVLMTVLGGVVRAVPLAAFGVMAKVVGESGLQVFPALGALVALVGVGMAIQVFVYYGFLLRWLGRRSPREFFRRATNPLITAMSTGSSLATLPVTLRTLEHELGVSKESARLAACVGTNLNHDGIVLYEAMAAMFVAQIYAIQLGFTAQLKLIGVSVIAAVGIAGVPEAGLITLSLVLGAAHLPVAAVPLLLPVDWLVGRMRATTNVASDLVVATLLDSLDRRKDP